MSDNQPIRAEELSLQDRFKIAGSTFEVFRIIKYVWSMDVELQSLMHVTDNDAFARVKIQLPMDMPIHLEK